ncbi:hypothetical protein EUGRSUZ_A01928 [Eucalyptus grandis]|uniref:Uncharacterized protein n=2 Tax=Eucalyptus grandis TaxID=71139 RepID=A0ACC3M4V5_EUCGR|nr:hypothetical protein EUGRSUZ_A01928 [Eucalyptus grandis]
MYHPTRGSVRGGKDRGDAEDESGRQSPPARPTLSSLDAVSPLSPRSLAGGHRSPLTPLLNAARSPGGRRSPLVQSPLTPLAQPPPTPLAAHLSCCRVDSKLIIMRISRYTEFGGAVPYRQAEDLAFSVVRFIQNSGSFINYYMYCGGTNFGRTAGNLFIATSYDYDAPLGEYGLLREPKWSHLRDLHKAIKQSEWALVSADPAVQSLGSNQEAHVFKAGSGCAASWQTMARSILS